MCSVQVKLFSNIFDLQLVKFVDMEPADVGREGGGWLRVVLYVLGKKYIVREVLKHSDYHSVLGI